MSSDIRELQELNEYLRDKIEKLTTELNASKNLFNAVQEELGPMFGATILNKVKYLKKFYKMEMEVGKKLMEEFVMTEDTWYGHLLKAPITQLDPSMLEIIKTWSNPPTSIQILEVLDKCINGGLASGFVITLLQVYYKLALKDEGIKHEDNLDKAIWRKEHV
jgi:DNA-directed RNA polymerase subunit F